MSRLICMIRVGNKVFPMRSPVSNFMYLLQAAFNVSTNANVVDTTNNLRTAGAYYSGGIYYYWVNGASQPAFGVDNYGIQVGSNATAVALTDYKLNTQIAHGTGGGQLQYSGQSIMALLVTGSPGLNRTFSLQRYFTNDSGGDVTIREIGLVVMTKSGGNLWPVLVARDLTGDVVVHDTEAVPVEITWQVSA